MKTLSGGQRKRVALAHELIFKPDVLILDEPTNHLDADTIEWLEDYLRRYTGALLLVTHDRYFLDRVTNRIFEIDRGAFKPLAEITLIIWRKKKNRKRCAPSKVTSANSLSKKNWRGCGAARKPARANRNTASTPLMI
jgi:ATPase subunit of ABC transporter with duplicated ATPase domains